MRLRPRLFSFRGLEKSRLESKGKIAFAAYRIRRAKPIPPFLRIQPDGKRTAAGSQHWRIPGPFTPADSLGCCLGTEIAAQPAGRVNAIFSPTKRGNYPIADRTDLAAVTPLLCAPATVAQFVSLQASPAKWIRSPTDSLKTFLMPNLPGSADA